MSKIPLSKCFVSAEVEEAALRAIRSGQYILGKESTAFEAELAAHTGTATQLAFLSICKERERLKKKHENRITFDASAAAHAERVEQVAKALHGRTGCLWEETNERIHNVYRHDATAALASLSKEL